MPSNRSHIACAITLQNEKYWRNRCAMAKGIGDGLQQPACDALG